MLGTERYTHSEAAGVLIVRVWREGSSANGLFRVRMVGQQDLARQGQETATASTIEDTLAYVGDWLQRFAASGR
jgi:hypothetical protein